MGWVPKNYPYLSEKHFKKGADYMSRLIVLWVFVFNPTKKTIQLKFTF